MRIRLALTILGLGILLLGLTPYPRTYMAALRQAQAHRAAREYGAALDTYRRATRLDPQAPRPWLRMGQVLLAQHRFTQAGAAFYQAGHRGAGIEALRGLGESHAGLGNWPAAMQSWLHLQELAPDDPETLVALGRGSLAQGNFEQAVRLLARALDLDPAANTARQAHALLGRLLLGQDPARAADHLRQAGDDDLLAVLAAADAEDDPARRALTLGAAFLQRGELSLARRAFDRATALAPEMAVAHAYLGHVLDRQGATAAGRQSLERALALAPDLALAHYFLGVHERLVGTPERAQDALWQALLLDPDNAAFRVEMGETFVAWGNYPRAEEWYQGAVEVAPEEQHFEFQFLLARFYVDHLYRVPGEGLAAAQAAVALAPGDARAQDLLGWAYHLAGQQSEARQTLNLALTLDPDLVSAHYHLGSLHAAAGRADLARQHLQRAADLDVTGYYRQRAERMLAGLD